MFEGKRNGFTAGSLEQVQAVCNKNTGPRGLEISHWLTLFAKEGSQSGRATTFTRYFQRFVNRWKTRDIINIQSVQVVELNHGQITVLTNREQAYYRLDVIVHRIFRSNCTQCIIPTVLAYIYIYILYREDRTNWRIFKYCACTRDAGVGERELTCRN